MDTLIPHDNDTDTVHDLWYVMTLDDVKIKMWELACSRLQASLEKQRARWPGVKCVVWCVQGTSHVHNAWGSNWWDGRNEFFDLNEEGILHQWQIARAKIYKKKHQQNPVSDMLHPYMSYSFPIITDSEVHESSISQPLPPLLCIWDRILAKPGSKHLHLGFGKP